MSRQMTKLQPIRSFRIQEAILLYRDWCEIPLTSLHWPGLRKTPTPTRTAGFSSTISYSDPLNCNQLTIRGQLHPAVSYLHKNIHTYIHTCIHAYIHTCIHTYIHEYIHTYIN